MNYSYKIQLFPSGIQLVTYNSIISYCIILSIAQFILFVIRSEKKSVQNYCSFIVYFERKFVTIMEVSHSILIHIHKNIMMDIVKFKQWILEGDLSVCSIWLKLYPKCSSLFNDESLIRSIKDSLLIRLSGVFKSWFPQAEYFRPS